MENINKYPFDLAELVEKELKSDGVEVPLNGTFKKIFENIYFASLKNRGTSTNLLFFNIY